MYPYLTQRCRTGSYNPFIVVRLAKVLVRTGETHEARIVYKRALESGAFDKRIHFNYAKLLIDSNDESGMDIEYHLRRSFTDGDGNTEAQLWHSRQLYIIGTAIHERFKPFGGVELELPPREPMREPPRFD